MEEILPPLAAFPASPWKANIKAEDWTLCLDAWVALTEAHLRLRDASFQQRSAKDDSVVAFLRSYAAADRLSLEDSSSGVRDKVLTLKKNCFLLSYRLLDLSQPPTHLLDWSFLADLSKLYGKDRGRRLCKTVWARHSSALESSISQIKALLISQLEAGLNTELGSLTAELKRLNHLLHVSTQTCEHFMAGSDFLDGLVSCYEIMNPPLRNAILSTTYLCVIGLTEGDKFNVSLLSDQLYALKSAAEAHKASPISVSDSLVAELVTSTPVIRQIRERLENSGKASGRTSSVLTSLQGYHKGGGAEPRRPMNRAKGKGKAAMGRPAVTKETHVHQMSLVSQVQDLFPDLGSGFIVKLLDEYGEDVEQVIAHLLEDSLPSHLQGADRSEQLRPLTHPSTVAAELSTRPTPPPTVERRNVFDGDRFDRLDVDSSHVHFGRTNDTKTAQDMLNDRSGVLSKASILSALATFDFDDDERDDTYDIQDVGGTVDSATPGNNPEEAVKDEAVDLNEETLFKLYKSNLEVFERDARRSKARADLKLETAMTDEAIEGWALMLSRDPRKQRKLEAKFDASAASASQPGLERTKWRASPAGSGTEDSDMDAFRGRGGHRGRGRGGRGGRGGNVSGAASDKDTTVARQRKEANKGSRANHNRRDQRAKKMARGGLAG